MYFIEHRKGRSPLNRETCAAVTMEAVLATAQRKARDLGADNIVILSRNGRVAGVFSTHSSSID